MARNESSEEKKQALLRKSVFRIPRLSLFFIWLVDRPLYKDFLYQEKFINRIRQNEIEEKCKKPDVSPPPSRRIKVEELEVKDGQIHKKPPARPMGQLVAESYKVSEDEENLSFIKGRYRKYSMERREQEMKMRYMRDALSRSKENDHGRYTGGGGAG
jgi:hypothetical protein